MPPTNDHPKKSRPTFQTRTATDTAGELARRSTIFQDDAAAGGALGLDGTVESNEPFRAYDPVGSSITPSQQGFPFTKRLLHINNDTDASESTPLLRRRSSSDRRKSRSSPARPDLRSNQSNDEGEDNKRTKPGLGPRPVGGHDKLGTFSGVFVPTCLNVLSILMFLRFGFILGQAGVVGMLGEDLFFQNPQLPG